MGTAAVTIFLQRIKSDKQISHPPVIVYTGQDLSFEEEERLNLLAESVILKGVRSHERLLDEATLLLHKLERDLPAFQMDIIQVMHGQDRSLEGRTILLVDDDMRNVFALSSILEKQGVTLLVGKHGREGIELLHQNDGMVDLVLMDIMMPEMDGYEAMRTIRRRSATPPCPSSP